MGEGIGVGLLNIKGKVAGVTGLEPATSGVTGQRSNQLSYTPKPDAVRTVKTAVFTGAEARRQYPLTNNIGLLPYAM